MTQPRWITCQCPAVPPFHILWHLPSQFRHRWACQHTASRLHSRLRSLQRHPSRNKRHSTNTTTRVPRSWTKSPCMIHRRLLHTTATNLWGPKTVPRLSGHWTFDETFLGALWWDWWFQCSRRAPARVMFCAQLCPLRLGIAWLLPWLSLLNKGKQKHSFPFVVEARECAASLWAASVSWACKLSTRIVTCAHYKRCG